MSLEKIRRLPPVRMRQFACACCRAVEDLLCDDSRTALDVIERFARGEASFDELVAARDRAKVIARRVRKERRRDRVGRRYIAAAEAVRDAGRNQAFEAAILVLAAVRRAGLGVWAEARLLNDFAGWEGHLLHVKRTARRCLASMARFLGIRMTLTPK
jgi:hypothetical protein